MEICEKEKNLLIDLFNKCRKQKKWISAKQFSADHADEIEVIEDLKRKELIEWDTRKDTFRIRFRVFILIEDELFKEALYSIEKIFNQLRDLYLEESEQVINIDVLAKKADLNRGQAVESLSYLQEVVSLSHGHDLSSPDAFVSPTEAFLKGFNTIIEEQIEYLDRIKSAPEEAKRLRANQLAKLLCQAIAKTLWDIYPEMTISEMCKHKAIQEYGGGAPYNKEVTIRRWLSEVDPRDKKLKGGHPKKKQ